MRLFWEMMMHASFKTYSDRKKKAEDSNSRNNDNTYRKIKGEQIIEN